MVSRSAFRIVCWYTASAARSPASAAATWPSMPPKVKIGPARLAPIRPDRGRAAEQRAGGRGRGGQRCLQRQVRVVQRARRADVGIGRHQVLLGAQDVGPAQQQRGRQVAGDLRRDQLVDGLAARDRPGVAAEQDRQQVLLRGDGLLELRDRRARLLRLRADLRQLGHRDHAGLVAQLEDAQRAFEVARGGLRDLQLPVQRAQHDVAGGHARHQRQHHAALALFAGIDLGLRGLGLAAHAAEQVGLPARAQRHVVEREVRVQRRRQRREAGRCWRARATRRHRSRAADTAASRWW